MDYKEFKAWFTDEKAIGSLSKESGIKMRLLKAKLMMRMYKRKALKMASAITSANEKGRLKMPKGKFNVYNLSVNWGTLPETLDKTFKMTG